MINTNELRIGNIIRHINANGTFDCPVSMLHKDGGIAIRPLRGGEWGMLAEDYEPIPLTEEILLKCGFKPIYESDFSVKLELQINEAFEAVRVNGGKWVVRFKFEHFKHIASLHQLQNLYFALTGSELQIEL